MPKPQPWLMLLYSLPARPSTRRVFVWRKLKAAGVLYIQNSVCLLPKSSPGVSVLKRLKEEIEAWKGTAQLSAVCFEEAGEEARLKERFRAQSDEDYAEIIDKCRDYHAELDKERKASHYTFAELEENEEELEKLKAWLPKIEARDCFKAKLGPKARAALKACVADFGSYSAEVIAREMPDGTPKAKRRR